MANLGAGLVGIAQVGYPSVIDIAQTFVNGPSPSPDSASRIDSEVINDILRTLIAIETALGANVQGVFGSLAARLNQFIPGGGTLPGIIPFSNATTFAVPGTTHNIGQDALLWQLYDANIPANAMEPGAVTVGIDTSTYDVFLTFSTPTSGLLALGATSPLFLQSFSNTTSVSVPGSSHMIQTADLLFKVYDNGSPQRAAIEPGSLTVHPTTRNVVMTFTTPQSGILVLSAATYATGFTGVASVSIPGTVHQLGTNALFFQFYDAATPMNAMAQPGITVNPTTFDVQITFGGPTSGRVVMGPASTLSGREFDVRDAGVVNSSAVRMRSYLGDLYLQPGTGQRIYLQDKLGATKMALDMQNTRVGIGTATPAHQLELTVNDAVKPGGGSWLTPSDERQKEALRPFTDGLDVALQLLPVLFRYNGLGGIPRSDTDQVGLVAQAVQAIAPYMVRTRRGRLTPESPETDLLILDEGALPYVLLNTMKTLHTWLVDLGAAQRQLETQVLGLEARLHRLEGLMP